MKDSPGAVGEADVTAFELLTRALIGIALECIQAGGGQVSLPQFRLLLALNGLGRVPSAKLAARVGLGAPAISRMVDRLEHAGLVLRGTDPRSRSIVTVELTQAGRDLVASVLERRHARLASVLTQMSPAHHAAAVRGAREFARLSGDAIALGESGPVPV